MRSLLILVSVLSLLGCATPGKGNRDGGPEDPYEVCGGGDEDGDGLIDETDRRDPAQGPCGGVYENSCPVGYHNCRGGQITGCEPSPEGEHCTLPQVDAGVQADASLPDAGKDAGKDGGNEPNCIEQAQAKCTTENTCACHINEMLKCLGYPAGYGTLCQTASQQKHYLCQASCPSSAFDLGSGFSDSCKTWSCCLVPLECNAPAASCSDATCDP